MLVIMSVDMGVCARNQRLGSNLGNLGSPWLKFENFVRTPQGPAINGNSLGPCGPSSGRYEGLAHSFATRLDLAKAVEQRGGRFPLQFDFPFLPTANATPLPPKDCQFIDQSFGRSKPTYPAGLSLFACELFQIQATNLCLSRVATTWCLNEGSTPMSLPPVVVCGLTRRRGSSCPCWKATAWGRRSWCRTC